MSGAFSVPLTFAAIYLPQAPLKALFAVLAGFAVVAACYLVWRDSMLTAGARIAELEDRIHNLTAQPRRTPAEEHRLNAAQQLLRGFGERASIAVTALRYLRNHGSLTFGTFDPPLPPSMKRDDVLWVYNACVPDGLVTVSKDHLRGEMTYSIPSTMNDLLDELLYES